jgi:hypothetical protein
LKFITFSDRFWLLDLFLLYFVKLVFFHFQCVLSRFELIFDIWKRSFHATCHNTVTPQWNYRIHNCWFVLTNEMIYFYHYVQFALNMFLLKCFDYGESLITYTGNTEKKNCFKKCSKRIYLSVLLSDQKAELERNWKCCAKM